MIKRICVTVGVGTLLSLAVLGPATASAQHGPGRHRHGSRPDYDPATETTFKGTVADVKSGQSLFSRLFRIHTLGLGHNGVQEKELLVKTDTDIVQILSVRRRSSPNNRWRSGRATLWK